LVYCGAGGTPAVVAVAEHGHGEVGRVGGAAILISGCGFVGWVDGAVRSGGNGDGVQNCFAVAAAADCESVVGEWHF
jgi:hypothetical protein